MTALGSNPASPPARIPSPVRRRGYILAAAVLLVMMAAGTLPIPLYVLYQKQMGFGPLGVTLVFAAFVVGTLLALLTLGDLSDHVGRRKVLAIAVICGAASAELFLAARGIGDAHRSPCRGRPGGRLRHRDRDSRSGRTPAAWRWPRGRGPRVGQQHDRARPRASGRWLRASSAPT